MQTYIYRENNILYKTKFIYEWFQKNLYILWIVF